MKTHTVSLRSTIKYNSLGKPRRHDTSGLITRHGASLDPKILYQQSHYVRCEVGTFVLLPSFNATSGGIHYFLLATRGGIKG